MAEDMVMIFYLCDVVVGPGLPWLNLPGTRRLQNAIVAYINYLEV